MFNYVTLFAGYSGLVSHKSSNAITIETELETALNKAGCIEDFNLGNLERLGWSRSSRTDKGVHARTVIVGV